jgi:hypothetical protein
LRAPLDEDRWLGCLFEFPTVLHDRASFAFDVNLSSLQKALFAALATLRTSSVPQKVSVADHEGYKKGRLDFNIGVGDGDAFDILDSREMDRVIGRIENQGPFSIIDLSFRLHYVIDDGRKHRIHEDHYLMRLVFRPGQFELLVHHVKGLRRVDSAELVTITIRKVNAELSRETLPRLRLAPVSPV